MNYTLGTVSSERVSSLLYWTLEEKTIKQYFPNTLYFYNHKYSSSDVGSEGQIRTRMARHLESKASFLLGAKLLKV